MLIPLRGDSKWLIVCLSINDSFLILFELVIGKYCILQSFDWWYCILQYFDLLYFTVFAPPYNPENDDEYEKVSAQRNEGISRMHPFLL